MATNRASSKTTAFLIKALVAASTLGLLSACAGETDTSIRRLGGDRNGDGPVAGGDEGSNATPGGTTPTGGQTPGPSTGGNGGGGGGGGGTVGPNATGKEFFTAKVFPELAPCVGCHGSGTQGAPKFLDAEAGKAYAEVEAYGMIQPESRLVKKGPHGNGGSAPGLSASAKAVVNEWVALELKKSGGKSTPSVLDKVALCMDQAQLQNIGLQTLRTVRRNGENANRCTGCTNASCSSCHGDTQTPFYMTIGSALGDRTFEMTKQQPFITKYFGVSNGEPVASNGLTKKMQAVNGDVAYGPHPNFTIPANVQQKLDAFVNDTIAKYKAGNCTGTPPATP
jgi:cytochrome c553